MNKNSYLFDGSRPQIHKGTSFNSICIPFEYGPTYQYKAIKISDEVEPVILIEDEDNKSVVNRVVALDDA
jgi:hypothetical protein